MSEHEIPWHDQDIFHDKVDAYPLHDFFPLEQKPASKNKNPSVNEDKNKTDWH